jgi:hypothetical protein
MTDMSDDAAITADALEPAPALETSYANAIRLSGGPYDIALDLGQRVGIQEPEWERRVYMSWTHAAALHRLLGTLIGAYERGTGQTLEDPEKALAAENPSE